MKRIFIGFRILIVIILVAAVGFTGWSVWRWYQQGGFVFDKRQAVVTELQLLERLETASFTVETIIDGGSQGNTLQQFLFGDRILLIAQGKVIAGIDFADFEKDAIDIDGSSITVTTPRPIILVTTLNENQTRVYDRQRGLLAPANNDLESEARQEAQQRIQAAACEADILNQAGSNAQRQLEALLRALQFEDVRVIVPAAEC